MVSEQEFDALELPDPEPPCEAGRFIVVHHRPCYGVAEYWTEDRLWDKRRSLAKVFTRRSVAHQGLKGARRSRGRSSAEWVEVREVEE